MKTIPWAWVTSGHHLDIGVFTSPRMSPGASHLDIPIGRARRQVPRDATLPRRPDLDEPHPSGPAPPHPSRLPTVNRVFYDAFGWARGRFAAKHGGPPPPGRHSGLHRGEGPRHAALVLTRRTSVERDANKRSYFRGGNPSDRIPFPTQPCDPPYNNKTE
jgi:hypothetical protein